MYHANVNVNLIVKNVPRIEIGITINVGASVKIKKKKKNIVCAKNYSWNPAICSCKNAKYLASIIGDSVITYDEIINNYHNNYQQLP